MTTSRKRLRRLADAYTFPGFRPQATVRGVFGDPQARVITLTRRSKKMVCSACGRSHSGWYDRKVRRVRDLSCGDTRVYLDLDIRRVAFLEVRTALKALLAANRRLNIAYLLKESFGQLWDYEREGWARRFFDNWRASLKWQRLKPYEKFAEMIERHWDGFAAYCKPENKVSLGLIEGLNNQIRVIQRRAYGLRDEEYLRLKILTRMLPIL